MKPLKRTVNTNFQKASQDALAAGQSQWVYQGRSGKTYTLSKREIPSSEIKERLKSSIYNDRGVDFLIGTACVNDIIDSIRTDKRPKFPGLVVGDGTDKDVVVSGNRRAHAVSLIDGAVFEYWYCDKMEAADIQALAKSSDKYDEPCPADRVFALRRFLEVEGRTEISRAELCERWDLAPQSVTDITNVSRVIPDSYFELFPALRYVPWNKTKTIAKSFKTKHIYDAISKVEGASNDLDDDQAKAESERIVTELMAILSPPRRTLSLPERWQGEPKKGVSVKPGYKGTISVTLKANALTTEEEQVLRKLLLAD